MATSALELKRSVSFQGMLTREKGLLAAVVLLTSLRFATAVWLPLSFDESYFWLWSKHLSLSYYDHPPLIALAIWLGTQLFGDTQFGVRAVMLVCSIASSWAIWKTASILIASEFAGVTACLLFNLTLMAASQLMGATPDALVITASSFLVYGLAKLQHTNESRWWFVIATALGVALLSKYTAFFLIAGVVLWLASTPQGRAWLKSPWPLTTMALAAMCFAPVLLWNGAHDWISFKFQFGRVVAGGLTLRYILEFIGAQFALASPFILVASVAGLGLATRFNSSKAIFTAAAIVWPAAIYFMIHALHDRVQGNWPSFVYPELALLAAWFLLVPAPTLRLQNLRAVSRLLAVPFAICILTFAYFQTWTGILPIGLSDPVARMMAVGIAPVTDGIAAAVKTHRDAAIVTTKYVVSGWLSFYLRPQIPVLQINQENRWLSASRATSTLLNKPLLYVTQHPQRELKYVNAHFKTVRFVKAITRSRNGAPVDTFYLYTLAGFHGMPLGRVVNAPSR